MIPPKGTMLREWAELYVHFRRAFRIRPVSSEVPTLRFLAVCIGILLFLLLLAFLGRLVPQIVQTVLSL